MNNNKIITNSTEWRIKAVFILLLCFISTNLFYVQNKAELLILQTAGVIKPLDPVILVSTFLAQSLVLFTAKYTLIDIS